MSTQTDGKESHSRTVEDILVDTTIDKSKKMMQLLLMIHGDVQSLKSDKLQADTRTTALAAEVSSLRTRLSGLEKKTQNCQNLSEEK